MADSVLLRVRVTGEFTKLADLIMQCGQCPWPGRSRRPGRSAPPRRRRPGYRRDYIAIHIWSQNCSQIPHPLFDKFFPVLAPTSGGTWQIFFPFFKFVPWPKFSCMLPCSQYQNTTQQWLLRCISYLLSRGTRAPVCCCPLFASLRLSTLWRSAASQFHTGCHRE